MSGSLLDVIPNYRRAAERWPDAVNLARCVAVVEAADAGDPHGAVEHVKCFVECLCITIMIEVGAELPTDASTTHLLRETLESVGLSNSRTGNRLDKILSAFNKLADALTDVRNSDGPVAHGKDGFIDVLTLDHARSYILVGNAIAGCLLAAFDGVEPDLRVSREPVERFTHLASRIDQVVAIEAAVETEDAIPLLVVTLRVMENQVPTILRLEPSRLLYGVDREAFVDLFEQSPVALASDVFEGAGDEVAVEPVALSTGTAKPPVQRSAQAYAGSVDSLRQILMEYLTSSAELRDFAVELADVLLPAIDKRLGLDWRSRPSLRAGMRLELRRTMVRVGVPPDVAKDASAELLDWLTESEASHRAGP